MKGVVAIAGLGNEAQSPATPERTMLLWGLVVGTTVGIFVGTLLIKPPRKRRS